MQKLTTGASADSVDGVSASNGVSMSQPLLKTQEPPQKANGKMIRATGWGGQSTTWMGRTTALMNSRQLWCGHKTKPVHSLAWKGVNQETPPLTEEL